MKPKHPPIALRPRGGRRHYRVYYPTLDEWREVPSVTSVLSVLQKDFLVEWSVRECTRVVQQRLPVGQVLHESTLREVLRQGRAEHKRLTAVACEFGTLVHRYAERVWRGVRVDQLICPDLRAARCLENLQDWVAREAIRCHATELPVASYTHHYAGTIDAVVYRDTRLVCADLKTSSMFSPTMSLQLAAYRQCLLETYGLSADQLLILRCPRVEPYKFEVLEIPQSEWDELFRLFLAARELYDWMYPGSQTSLERERSRQEREVLVQVRERSRRAREGAV